MRKISLADPIGRGHSLIRSAFDVCFHIFNQMYLPVKWKRQQLASLSKRKFAPGMA